MKFVSSQEMIEFHDRLISRDGGVAGMPEPGRADAIMFVAQVFLKRNGIHIISSRISFDEMQIIALNAATGEYNWKMVSDHLKAIILN
ncbi:hypothetical protein GKN67_003757 [Escherichia coli]|nr:hypothetical protein [Escherichia coli]